MPEVQDLKRYCHDVDKFKAYSKSLIPERFRDIPELESNQLYVCANVILKSDVHYDIKGVLVEKCMESVHIYGCLQNVIELVVVEQMLDANKLEEYIRQLRLERVQNEYSVYS